MNEDKKEGKGYKTLMLISKPIYFMGLSPIIFAILIISFFALVVIFSFLKLLIIVPFLFVGLIMFLVKINKIVKEGHPNIAYSFLTIKPATKKRYYDKNILSSYIIENKKK